MAKLTLNSTLPLPNSSLTIPRLGFGVYQSHGPTCIASCLKALEAGYRHIDSAQFYRNEEQVGIAVAKSAVPRADLFLTSKILSSTGSVEGDCQKISESVKLLGGFADLFLIHNSSGGLSGRKTKWQALEQAHSEGKCKAIGVSNWGIGHIEEMKGYAKVWPPHVNQIELHPWCQQRETVEYCQRNNIVVEAYCPLVRNEKANDPTLISISEKHKKSSGQVLIRYCLQKNWSPLPKSDTPHRIEGNTDVYNFELDSADMKSLDDLDEGPRGALVMVAQNEL